MGAYAYLGYDIGGITPFTRQYILEFIPDPNLAKAAVQDGWGDRFDTASAVISDDPGITRYFYADMLLVVLEAGDTRRLFGPFDIKSVDDQNAIGEYTLSAVADRWIERTVFQSLDALQGQVSAILGMAPYTTWLDAATKEIIEIKINTGLAAAKSLSDMRSALAKYDLTLVPDEVISITSGGSGSPISGRVSRANIPAARLANGNLVVRQRRAKVATLAPLSETSTADGAGGDTFKTINVDSETGALSGLRDVALLRRRPMTQETLRATRAITPDRYNAPGDYVHRQITVGYRQPERGFNAIYTWPTEARGAGIPLFPVELDAVAANRALGAWAVNAARRTLQNSAARAALTIPEGYLTGSPNSILNISSPALPGFGENEWRVERANHASMGEAIETILDVVLWQGESSNPAYFPQVFEASG